MSDPSKDDRGQILGDYLDQYKYFFNMRVTLDRP